MPTLIEFARPDASFADRPSISRGKKLLPAPAAVRAKDARFAVTGEDISSLLTVIPVGLLALITFGAMLTSH